MYLNTKDTQLGRGEPIEDSAQVISRMTDIVMIRTFGQDIIERFAANSRVPVINGLTNEYHPCQVSADIYTYIEERGDITGKTVAWVGDANNMCYTWIQAARVLGFHLNIATPAGYALDPKLAVESDQLFFTVCETPMQACTGAHIITTDVWTSMGYEAENEARMKAFADYKITAEMMQAAAPMPCSCTVYPHTVAKKWMPKSSTARKAWCGKRRKTACMCKKRLWNICCVGSLSKTPQSLRATFHQRSNPYTEVILWTSLDCFAVQRSQ